MSEGRKYIKVWIEKRLNPPKQDGSRSTSYTLEWVEYGRRSFKSLGPGATKAFALAAAKAKEAQLNDVNPENFLVPITWKDFREKFLTTHYPGFDMPKKKRMPYEAKWVNAVATMRDERLVLDKFQELVNPTWCHEITSEDRELFIQARMSQVDSGETINKNLKTLRHLFNVLEEWNHRQSDTNPFSGSGRATIGRRRRKQKQLERRKAGKERPEYFSLDQIRAMLAQADKEAKMEPDSWSRHRLRALIYFVAYTGARPKEVLFLEWPDIDLNLGIARLCCRIENMLKTEASEAPVGLADPLISVLKEWRLKKKCSWVFPNLHKDTPWVTGSPGHKPLDQLKELAERAGVTHATFKMFRDSVVTLGKSRFGLTEAQVQSLVRHTTTKTQVHYTHSEIMGLRANANAFDFSQVPETTL